MSVKNANVNARVEQSIKQEADGILAIMGIPAFVGINMFYKQIIYCHGLPFRTVAYSKILPAIEDMTTEEFDARMSEGLRQSKAGEGNLTDDAFDELIRELNRG